MERGLIPDPLVRFGIRKLCDQRLKSLVGSSEDDYAKGLRALPIAISTADANQQHYELPQEFFGLVLGRNRKYSSCFWDEKTETLDAAEDVALKITMERAELADGMKVLELGCGWGSLTLAMARKFPKSQIVALSNSTSQRSYIEAQAKKENLTNVQIITCDISQVDRVSDTQFDRVVSVEMFEHMKNYEKLLRKIRGWLNEDGKLFVHIFTHVKHSYPFEVEGEDNWMGRYFFTGGQMPATDLLPKFDSDFELLQKWIWNGQHYQKTSEAWLKNFDSHQKQIRAIFLKTYGTEADLWMNRWRVFFLSVAELFGFDHGQQWNVSHYLLKAKGQ